MISIGNYLLQMSCWLAAFWLVYHFVLRKETFFHANRWFLNIGLIVSTLMPFIPVRYKVLVQSVSTDTTILQPIETILPLDLAEEVNYWLVAYSVGILFFIVRFFWQHFNLIVVRRKSNPLIIDSLKVHRIEKETAPFSFFNRIYVSSSLKGNKELETIVAHEKVHIIERHWADLLLLEVVRAIQWFNPLTQLYRKAMMQNHEYLADMGTIELGVSAHTYQAVLANQMLGIPVVRFANSFTFMNSQNRLKMMKRNKSNPRNMLKGLLILPLVALILVSFAKPKYEYLNKEAPNLPEEIIPSSEILIGLNQFENDGLIFMMENDTKKVKVKGKVLDENKEPLPGTSIVISNSNRGTVANLKGEFEISNVELGSTITFSFVGFKTLNYKVESDDYRTFVMKPVVVALEVAGKRDFIPTPMPRNNTMKPNAPLSPPPPPAPNATEIKIGPGPNNVPQPLIVVDGKILETSVDNIDPESIEKIEVLKDESATAVYGEKGKNGVVLITSKKGVDLPPPPPPPTQDDMLKSFDGKKPLVFVDGKVHKMDLEKLFSNPEQFKTINILKGEAAIKKYGDKAKDGAIEITSMMAYQAKTEEEVFVIVEEMPKYPGGKKALDKYILSEVSKMNLEGHAYVTFLVKADGSIADVKTIRSSSKKLNKYAEKIVKGMENWTPGKQRGKPVKVQYTVKIEF